MTGSTGLLGANLVRTLRAAGWEVRALVRSLEKGKRLLGDTGTDLVPGDVTEVASFESRLEGCDLLFHCAAYFREYFGAGEHWAKLERVNVHGSLAVHDAAEQAGVGKAVYVSTSGVLDRSSCKGGMVDESAPYALGTRNLYFRSKIQAEQAVLERLDGHGLPVTLVNPGWLFGPWDEAPTASGRLVLDFVGRRLPAVPPGGESVADARDVAAAMVAAAERGRSGERYIVGGKPITLRGLMGVLQEVTGVRAPRLDVPYPVAMAIAWASETAARLRHTDTLITRVGIRTLMEGRRCALSSRKAADELGVTFRPLQETLHDELAWYQERGMVVLGGRGPTAPGPRSTLRDWPERG